MGKIINPANAVTASRYLTIVPFYLYVKSGDVQKAGIMLTLCALADLFDGAVARKFNCSSGFGEFFDAVTDAICYGFFMMCLVYFGLLPWIPILGVVVLGIVNSVFRVMYAKRAGETTNFRSWAMEKIVGYLAYLCGFGLLQLEASFFAWMCFAITIVVMIHDTKRMLIDPVTA